LGFQNYLRSKYFILAFSWPRCGRKTGFRYPCFAMLFDDGDYTRCTPFERAVAVCLRKNQKRGVRQQMNVLSSYLDASQIYSENVKHASELRKLDGKQYLRNRRNRSRHYPVDTIAERAVGRSVFLTVFLTIWHCNLSA